MSEPSSHVSQGGMAMAWAVARRLASQPLFLLTAVVLLVAAIGLNATTRYMRLHFRKEAVPLAQPLTSIAAQVGHWRLVSIDQKLDADMEHALDTDQYVFRDYLDDRLVPADKLAEFKDKTHDERGKLVARIQAQQPAAVMRLMVTYYTGMVDTVAHIPDRCYIADGYVPSQYKVVKWPVGREPVSVRFIRFEDQTGYSSVIKTVCYFFHCNGQLESDPLGVRRRLQNLRERHGYYAKIELMSLAKDPEQAASVMTDFLKEALPEIQKCLPDWNRVVQESVRKE